MRIKKMSKANIYDLGKKCPYCGADIELKDSSVIYGRSYGLVYVCSNYPNCDAYVGTHKGTTHPLGSMANAELRKWRKEAHMYFDTIWKCWKEEGVKQARSKAYKWLAEALGTPDKEVHIAWMGVTECQKVIEICEPRARIEAKKNKKGQSLILKGLGTIKGYDREGIPTHTHPVG